MIVIQYQIYRQYRLTVKTHAKYENISKLLNNILKKLLKCEARILKTRIRETRILDFSRRKSETFHLHVEWYGMVWIMKQKKAILEIKVSEIALRVSAFLVMRVFVQFFC